VAKPGRRFIVAKLPELAPAGNGLLNREKQKPAAEMGGRLAGSADGTSGRQVDQR